MRYGSVLILIAVFCTGPDLGVRAQIPHLACAPGQVAQPMVQPDGTVKYGCAAAHLMAHDPPGVGAVPACGEDSDCPPGPTRCIGGYCSRSSFACNSDTDCKYSEFCDTSRASGSFAGLCAPRGGHY